MNVKKFFLVLMAVVVMASIAAAPVAAQTTCTRYHTVQRGEYLVKIARQYDVSWRYLADINDLANPSRIYPGQKLCVATTGSGTGGGDDSGAPYTGIPTFSISSVVAGKTVTIQTNNFPANDSFDVLMGQMGTRGVNGIKVTSINSGKGGSFTATFDIPATLADHRRIAIRLQSNTGSGYYAYNWFYNTTADSGTGGGDDSGSPSTGYKGYPTFSIASVVRDQSVTVSVRNLPPNDTFRVLMGPMGTRGVNGYQVTTFNTGNGGNQSFTFDIPSQLDGSYQIAIRIEATTGSGYFAYNWFYNNTTN
ncbi:MAG: LysM peptidoglycan-binding domain-containing protein [Chloroflexi bacterium]|jgi:hypothetical protein|nr:LysM peptidoglycan-binding domain-containing protein [Chloroflexota bacterium]